MSSTRVPPHPWPTPYHAIRRSRHLLLPQRAAVVIGVGGLGLMAVQLLTALARSTIIARSGALRPHIETFPLREAVDVYRRLHDGQIAGRAVVLPHG